MPVTVEEVCVPSGQDLIDLQKIYEDAPDWMLEHWQTSTHESAIEVMLKSVPENKERHLYAARFNSRLLAAILVDENSDSWLLHRLCVRNLTRSRGVGGRLLELVIEKAKHTGKRISLHDPERLLHHERLQQTAGDYELIHSIQDCGADYYQLSPP